MSEAREEECVGAVSLSRRSAFERRFAKTLNFWITKRGGVTKSNMPDVTRALVAAIKEHNAALKVRGLE